MKRIIIGIIVAVVLVGGLVAAVIFRPVEPAAPQQANQSQDDEPDQTDEVLEPGRYEDYDPQLASSAGYKETILFFHASWCPECRAFEKQITATSLPDGVQILKVDYDTADDLKQKHGVTLQSTFVRVNKAGDQISKWVGYGEDKSVDAILENT